MAVSLVTGISTALGAAAAAGTIKALVFFGLQGWAAFAAWAALGAGLAMVSRALAPKPNLGAQMRGITQTTREPAGTRKIVYGKMRVGGQVVFISHSGADNKYLHMAIAFATHEIESYEEVWFNDKKVWTNSGGFQDDWGTYVTFDRKYGTASQTASTQLVNAHTLWTSNHKLSGIAYIAFRLEWNADKFPQGVPNITTVLKGKKVYDPRDGNQSATDASTWTFSQNPALCLRDYLVDQKYGLGEDRTLVDSTSLTAAANLCDETQNSGTDIYSVSGQKRYELNGVIDVANNIKDNIEQMLSAMGGNLTYSGGKYFIQGAEYVAPTVTFDEADCISELSLQTKQSRRGVYNGVKGIFVSESKNWKVLDYPAQISSTYQAEDGDPILLDMPLPFVTDVLQAQLLAKLALLRSRQQVVLQVTTNLKGLRVKVGDTVNLTNARLGYSSKVFEVIEYGLTGLESGAIGVELTLIETSSAVYDWTTSDESDFLSGGELDLYDGRTVDNVTSLSHSVIALKGPDGKNITNVDFSWTAPTDAFVEFYIITIEKDSDGNIFEYQSREPRLRVPNLDIGSAYEVIVKAENLVGVKSSGTTLNIASLSGDTTAPAVPTNPSTTGGIRQITVEWTEATDEDLALTLVYYNDTNNPNTATRSKTRGEEFVYTLADNETSPKTKYFWLSSIDHSGNESNKTTAFTGTSVATKENDILDGAVGTGKIADDAVDSDKLASGAVDLPAFASGVNPIQVVSSLPSPADQGDMAFLTTDNNLYRYNSSAWTKAITLNEVSDSGALAALSTVGSSQIDNDAITNAKIAVDAIQGDVIAAGAITSTKIGEDAVTTAKIANDAITNDLVAAAAITTTEIGNDAITTAKIAANAVTASEIAAGAVTASEIAANTITAGEIAAGAVTATEIAANTITSAEIAANTITASEIASGTVTATQIAAGTITSTQIAADAITANEIAAGAVSTDALAAGAVTTAKLDAGAVTANEIAANTITAAQIASGAVSTSELAANAVTAGKIQAASITVDKLSGDVSEVFNLSVSVYPYHSVPEGTSNADTFAEFTIPAPDSTVTKYASLNGKLKFIPSTSLDECLLRIRFERKSKGVSSGTSLGSIVGSGTTGSPYRHYVEVSGNYTTEIDPYGGVATSQTSPSNVSKAQSVHYIGSNNRTRIEYSGSQSSTPTYTSGTLYYNPDRWISSGTYLDDAAGLQSFMIPDIGSLSATITLPLNQALAKSNAAEEYRVRVHTTGRSTGTLSIVAIDSQIFLMT